MKTGLSKAHVILLIFVVGNLAVVALFPPCDYLALAHPSLPTFDGFHPVFDLPVNRRINQDFLALEGLVVLINGCLGWLLINHASGPNAYGRITRGLILFLILNLILVVLFPPFADFRSLSRDFIPSFEGFYWVFGDNSRRRLVDEILFIEIAMLLANAALVWLIVRESNLQDKLLSRPGRPLV
ncbi:MAG TPA: hypothetical protein VN066_10200 [Rhodocyclaceae bacterium]|jgi:hypothetical protein|nr:hypothetical protein [Rhodocyclaceae bacterium]